MKRSTRAIRKERQTIKEMNEVAQGWRIVRMCYTDYQCGTKSPRKRAQQKIDLIRELRLKTTKPLSQRFEVEEQLA